MPEQESTSVGPWWSKKRRVALAAVAFLAMVILFFVIQGLDPADGPGSAASPAPTVTQVPVTPTPEPESTADNSKASTRTCPFLPDGDQSVPASGPEAEWAMYRKVAVPFAPTTFGPADRTDGIARCFSHNPSGALIAAAHILSVAWQDGTVAMVSSYARESPEKSSVLEVLRNKATSPPAAVPQITGYRITMDHQDRAQIQIVVSAQDSLIRGLVILEWTGNDWAVEPTTVMTDMGEEVPDLTGYTAWESPTF